MSNVVRIFYQVLGLFASASPGTGYQFSSGNSGANLVNQLQRVQTCTDGWTANRQNVIQWGQLGALDRVIIDPLASSLTANWYVADLTNENAIGLNVGNGVGLLNSIIDQSQAEKNYYIAIAPPGVDLVGWTGESQVIQVTNGYIASYTCEGAVGQIPTASISVQGYNWATSTGSVDQVNQAIETVSGTVPGNTLFTIPVLTTGNVGSTSVIRPAEIQVNVANDAIGLDTTDFKIQRYQITADLNLQNINRLGSKFPFAKVIQFPITFRASITADWGSLITGSINNLFCADNPYDITINLYQACSTVIAAQYNLVGVKLDSQELSQMAVGDLAANVTLNFDGTIGSAASSQSNLIFSGIV